MRVVSGSAKGKKLKSVPGSGTRPILDRVKTALFDKLRPVIVGSRWLDLFAGSGSVGIEALSQGAAHCVFIDMSRDAVQVITENLEGARLLQLAEVRNQDAFTYLRNSRRLFEIVYVAPPQYKAIWVEVMHTLAERPDLLAEDALVIVQIDPKEYENLLLSYLLEIEQRKYGNSLLVFYRKCAPK